MFDYVLDKNQQFVWFLLGNFIWSSPDKSLSWLHCCIVFIPEFAFEKQTESQTDWIAMYYKGIASEDTNHIGKDMKKVCFSNHKGLAYLPIAKSGLMFQGGGDHA